MYSAVNLYLLWQEAQCPSCRHTSSCLCQAQVDFRLSPVTFKQAKNTHVTPGFRQGGKALQIFPARSVSRRTMATPAALMLGHRTIRIRRPAKSIKSESAEPTACASASGEVRTENASGLPEVTTDTPSVMPGRRLCREASVHVGYLVLNAT